MARFHLEKCCSVTVFVLFLVCCVLGEFQYPDVPRNESLEEDYFGTIVKDQYRWLEDANSELTNRFVEEQNKVTFGYIRKNPNLEKIKQSFIALHNYTSYGHPLKRGDNYYMNIQTGLQNQGVYYRLKSLNDTSPQMFINPNNVSSDGTVSLVFAKFSPDNKYCAYGLSSGGSDWIKIRIKNSETLEDLNEELTKTKLFSYVQWNKNSKGFFYAYYDTYNGTGVGTETEVPKDQKLYYHKLNTPQEEDIRIYAYPDDPMFLIGTPHLNEDGTQLHLFPAISQQSLWVYADIDPNEINSSFTFKTVFDKPGSDTILLETIGNCSYVQTNYKAKNSRIACVDVTNSAPENWIDLIPEHSEFVLSTASIVNKKYLACIYIVNVVNVIKMFDLETGKYLFDVDTPMGTIDSIAGQVNEPEFFFTVKTFLSPGVTYRYNFNVRPNKLNVFKQSSISGLNENDYITRQIFYTSKDNVKVPMFLVHKKNIQLDGKNPTMLYAYGGFNANIQPEYKELHVFFIKHLNGVFALANIRGGGEYGEDWHRAGILTRKQTVFDDFASAGEWLINNKYTSRNYLTINGRSNGGLLMGASSNQRPDLFGATLAYVGVMDMIRFPLFTIGYAWRSEYGDPQNVKAHFEYIYQYSPLHNINANLATYPQMLVLTADHDDRVVPAHSYKFISELQYKLGKKLPNIPLLIRIDANSGHGSGKPVGKKIEEEADVICFLLNGMPYQYQP